MVGFFTQYQSVKNRLFTQSASPNGLAIVELTRQSYWFNIKKLTELCLAPTAEFRLNQFAQHTEQSTRLNEQNALVTQENARLQKENAAHVQRVSDLERRLGLMSGISSKPPSSDGLTKPSTKEKRTLSQRSTSNRKSGGQPGHKGTVLKQVENPDEVADHYPNQFRACQAALSPDELIRSAARQVFDLALLHRLLSSNIVRALASVIIAVHRPDPLSPKE